MNDASQLKEFPILFLSSSSSSKFIQLRLLGLPVLLYSQINDVGPGLSDYKYFDWTVYNNVIKLESLKK